MSPHQQLQRVEPGPGEPMIRLRGIAKSFGTHQVLDGLDLDVQRGETMVVIGGSGTGKSVLLKHIIGLLSPDAGEVVVDGVSVARLRGWELKEFRKEFGMLFQGAALFDSLRVLDNVAFGLREHTRLKEPEIRERVREKLALVGLHDVEQLWPAELSGGMKKRVALARALAMEPKILLYDEPTTGLDPIRADAINDLILELRTRLKVTGVAITHDMTSAYKIADRIAMLYKGRIIAVGTPQQIRGSEDPVVRQFITGSARGPITD
jgi:phospholipid/cholesterol/gamma-HCH transport system ATP-binding protein